MIRKATLVSIMLVGTVCLLLFVRARSGYRLTLHAYFHHVQKVQKGMPVCVDGVQVGSVSSVMVKPELGDRPVEVVLVIQTPYELRIPADSPAQIAEPGILRTTVVDIDTRAAHGPPVASGGTLEGADSKDDEAAHALGVVVKALVDQAKAGQDQAPQDKPSNPKRSPR